MLCFYLIRSLKKNQDGFTHNATFSFVFIYICICYKFHFFIYFQTYYFYNMST